MAATDGPRPDFRNFDPMSQAALTLKDLHQAMRSGRLDEAAAIARILHDRYRDVGAPRSLRQYLEEVLGGTLFVAPVTPPVVPTAPKATAPVPMPRPAPKTLAPSPATPIDHGAAALLIGGRAWKSLGEVRDDPRLRAVLALWNLLHPGTPVQLRATDGSAPTDLAAALWLAEGSPALRTALATTAGAFLWIDGWFSDSATLRLRLAAQPRLPVAALSLLQWDAPAQALVECAALTLKDDGGALHDARLLHPLAPVLLATLDSAGRLLDAALLPFPSLLRHGLHHAELCAAAFASTAPEAASDHAASCLRRLREGGWARVRSIEVALQDATGHELPLRPAVQAWLNGTWGIEVVLAGGRSASGPARPDAPAGSTEAAGASLRLRIEGNGVPTLRALTGLEPATPGEAALPRPPAFLLTEPFGWRPMALIEPGREPAGATGPAHPTAASDRLTQLEDGRPWSTPEPVTLHVAVEVEDLRYPLTFPTDVAAAEVPAPAPSAGAGFDIVLHGDGDADDLAYSLWSLAQQDGARLSRLAIVAPAGKALDAARRAWDEVGPALPGVEPQFVDPAVELSAWLGDTVPSDGLLMMTQGLCLHQPATLRVLAGLIVPGEVASAGCLLVQEQHFGKGRRVTVHSCGLYPESLGLGRVDGLRLVQAEVVGSLGLRDFSVLCNVPDLVLLSPRHAALRQAVAAAPAGGPIAQVLVDASIEAVLGGALHRVTSRISASYRRPPAAGRPWRVSSRLQPRALAQLPTLLAAGTRLLPLAP